MRKSPEKGSVILNREMTTQIGKLTSKKGMLLMSVFLGSIRETDDMSSMAFKRLESMGWRQMEMYECAIRITIPHEDRLPEHFDTRLAFSCLGHVDAVEASVRFSDKMLMDEFNRCEVGTPAPFLQSIAVGTIQVGPISEDGTPFNGRGPAYFSWSEGCGIALDDHLQKLRDRVKDLSR